LTAFRLLVALEALLLTTACAHRSEPEDWEKGHCYDQLLVAIHRAGGEPFAEGAYTITLINDRVSAVHTVEGCPAGDPCRGYGFDFYFSSDRLVAYYDSATGDARWFTLGLRHAERDLGYWVIEPDYRADGYCKVSKQTVTSL
jgi:hypothetical protein